MIGVIRNALNLLNVDVFFQMIAIGLIIVVAVQGDVFRNHLEARTGHAGGEDAMRASAAPRSRGPSCAKALRRGARAEGCQPRSSSRRGAGPAWDNGAGKSTLVKCVSGVYALDDGEILLDGEAASIHSPGAARRAGIETVYQTSRFSTI